MRAPWAAADKGGFRFSVFGAKIKDNKISTIAGQRLVGSGPLVCRESPACRWRGVSGRMVPDSPPRFKNEKVNCDVPGGLGAVREEPGPPEGWPQGPKSPDSVGRAWYRASRGVRGARGSRPGSHHKGWNHTRPRGDWDPSWHYDSSRRRRPGPGAPGALRQGW